MDVSATDSISEVIGFTPGVYPAAPSVETLLIIVGDLVANFSQVEFLFLQSNILDVGINYNGIESNGVIHKHIISAGIGSKSTYQPSLVPWISCNELAGKALQILTFTLLDQELKPIDMVSEIYEFTLQIKYQLAE